jgi:predicted transposase YbfD/YdcC
MLELILFWVKSLTDFRVIGRTKHSLTNIIMIALIATMYGTKGWNKIENWANRNFKVLQIILPDLKAIPSADTFARVISKVSPIEMGNILNNTAPQFLSNDMERTRGRPKDDDQIDIAIDGKASRGAKAPGKKSTETHIVNAVCENTVLTAVRVAKKSNEITAIPIVLENLDKQNLLKKRTLITTDAMGCQKKIAEKIRSYDANWLFGLKRNHKSLSSKVVELFENDLVEHKDEFIVDTFESGYDKVAGRIEKRTCNVIHINPATLEKLGNAKDWCGLQSVLKVERFVSYTDSKKNPNTIKRYFISSLSSSAEKMLDNTVKHWKVETTHNRLDNHYSEDKCRVYKGNAAENLSIMRKIGLNFVVPIVQRFQADRESVSSVCEELQANFGFLLEVLTKKPNDVRSPQWWREQQHQFAIANVMPERALNNAA